MHIMMLLAALGINFARQGIATQSSRYVTAQKAIDGKAVQRTYSAKLKHANCVFTGVSNNPWWTLYMKKIISVSLVIIHNRDDWRGKYLQWYMILLEVFSNDKDNF